MSVVNIILRYLYAPLFFLGFVGCGLEIIGTGHTKLWFLPLLAGAVLISFIAERVTPYEPVWNLPQADQRRDWIHAVVNELSNVSAIALIPFIAMLDLGIDKWPAQWPLWGQLLFAILIADLGITLSHYASHKINSLWKLHAVHHSVDRLYGFNGLMKHPLHQAIELMAGTTPLLLLGIPMDVASLLGFAVAIQLLLQHSNVDMRIGPFIIFWAVAPGHRHHHRASSTDGDVNFGFFTMTWDHILGTYVGRGDQPRAGELGIAGRTDYPVTYVRQIIEPFRAG